MVICACCSLVYKRFKVKENVHKNLFSFWCAFEKFQKASISFLISVRSSAWNNSAPAGRIFMKFDVSFFFFRNSAEKSQVSIKSDLNNEHFYVKMYVHLL
jgi:hypothetical protein